MKREIILTKDGLKTIYLPEWIESYHSIHGAYQEAMYVFIDKGLNACAEDALSILEIGFGTGLNAILTLMEGQQKQLKIDYTSIEAYPISSEEMKALDYCSYPEISEFREYYLKMQECNWEQSVPITSLFSLLKIQDKLATFKIEKESFDLIYFDAFGPRVQPEMWTLEVFQKMHQLLKKGGILVTYCAKGQVRRDMQAIGFQVERLPGPPRKREMLRATKTK